jgi:NNP family nitrate/nitrite transporter-like MFS transporter
MALRFFIGILGGSFVPCQVWSTGFFDKNVVGTSNALTAGFGNAGGGVTYFLMPAIFDSLVMNQKLSAHVAWRVAFVVPFIIIVATTIAFLVLCPDTPTGKWSERHLAAQQNLAGHGITGDVVDVPGEFAEKKTDSLASGSPVPAPAKDSKLVYDAKRTGSVDDSEAQIGEQQMLDTARGEVIRKPTWNEAMPVVFSMQTLVTCGCYFCSFGAELAINSILGAYYLKNFKSLGQTGSGRWAAMFGLLNIVFRPMGGLISDALYPRLGVWGRKLFLHGLAIITGVFLIAIGLTNPKTHNNMFGLVAGMALFLEAGNGANFALVPHVHPYANGIVSGCTGAAGNLGGIIFAIIFRYNGTNYAKVFWIIGVITIVINLSLSWIRPIPKGQIGGR